MEEATRVERRRRDGYTGESEKDEEENAGRVNRRRRRVEGGRG